MAGYVPHPAPARPSDGRHRPTSLHSAKRTPSTTSDWFDAPSSVHNAPSLAFLDIPPVPRLVLDHAEPIPRPRTTPPESTTPSDAMPLRKGKGPHLPSLLGALSTTNDPAFSSNPSSNPHSNDAFLKPPTTPQRGRTPEARRFSELSMLPSPAWDSRPSYPHPHSTPHPYLNGLQAVPLSDHDLAATSIGMMAITSPSTPSASYNSHTSSSGSSSWSSHDSSEILTPVDTSPVAQDTKTQRGRLPPAYVADPSADPASSAHTNSNSGNSASASPSAQESRRPQKQRKRTSSRPPPAEITPIEELEETMSIHRLQHTPEPERNYRSASTPPTRAAVGEASYAPMPQPQIQFQSQSQVRPPRPSRAQTQTQGSSRPTHKKGSTDASNPLVLNLKPGQIAPSSIFQPPPRMTSLHSHGHAPYPPPAPPPSAYAHRGQQQEDDEEEYRQPPHAAMYPPGASVNPTPTPNLPRRANTMPPGISGMSGAGDLYGVPPPPPPVQSRWGEEPGQMQMMQREAPVYRPTPSPTPPVLRGSPAPPVLRGSPAPPALRPSPTPTPPYTPNSSSPVNGSYSPMNGSPSPAAVSRIRAAQGNRRTASEGVIQQVQMPPTMQGMGAGVPLALMPGQGQGQRSSPQSQSQSQPPTPTYTSHGQEYRAMNAPAPPQLPRHATAPSAPGRSHRRDLSAPPPPLPRHATAPPTTPGRYDPPSRTLADERRRQYDPNGPEPPDIHVPPPPSISSSSSSRGLKPSHVPRRLVMPMPLAGGGSAGSVGGGGAGGGGYDGGAGNYDPYAMPERRVQRSQTMDPSSSPYPDRSQAQGQGQQGKASTIPMAPVSGPGSRNVLRKKGTVSRSGTGNGSGAGNGNGGERERQPTLPGIQPNDPSPPPPPPPPPSSFNYNPSPPPPPSNAYPSNPRQPQPRPQYDPPVQPPQRSQSLYIYGGDVQMQAGTVDREEVEIAMARAMVKEAAIRERRERGEREEAARREREATLSTAGIGVGGQGGGGGGIGGVGGTAREKKVSRRLTKKR